MMLARPGFVAVREENCIVRCLDRVGGSWIRRKRIHVRRSERVDRGQPYMCRGELGRYIEVHGLFWSCHLGVELEAEVASNILGNEGIE